MNGKLALLVVATIGLAAPGAPALDPFYHTNAEIYDQIVAWQQTYPDTVLVDTIGYSQQDSLPIWAVKLSDHVHLDEDEPTVLYVGQVHAEEILGVEVVMALMDTILTKRMQYPYRAWLQGLELWLVPTANPEGHQVVMDEWDLSYRKNKRDCNLNGIFNFQPGMGNDSDGVDINRNFPLNWVHGDTFLQPGTEETYDYFRGFSPLSESEDRALWDFGALQKFSFSIVWHSSRSGANAEKVFYPWNWEESGKYSPDFEVIDYLASETASRIPKLTGGGASYNYVPTNSADGNQHDSFYAQFGTISFLIECGNNVMQPPESTARQVIAANLNGATFILNRAAGYDASLVHSQITGVVQNAAGAPIPAVVTVLQADGPYLTPRTCDPVYGRYRRFLMPGSYDLHVSLRGYYPQTAVGVLANAGGKTIRNFTLQPKPIHVLSGQVGALGGDPLAGTMFIHGEDVADTVLVAAAGQFSHSLPEGVYQVIVDAPGYVVHFEQVNLNQDRNVTIELSSATILFSDDFEAGLGQWTSGGANSRWGTEPADSLWGGGKVASDSPDTAYLPQSENWLELAAPLDLTGYVTAALRFQHWYYFEPGYDHGQVEVSADGGNNWTTICGPFDRQDIGWGTAYGDLNPYCGLSDVRVRWYFWSDQTLNEQGWRFDDVQVLAADTATSVAPETALPSRFELSSIFPNPFNPSFSVMLSVPQAQVIELTLWDVSGRQIVHRDYGRLSAGPHRLALRMPPGQATGVYLLLVRHQGGQEIRKILYLK